MSRKALALGAAALLATGLFARLGVWQLERRVWKLDLIARVDRRLHAPPIEAPPPPAWPTIGSADEYRRVRIAGRFEYRRETRVQAVTEAGGGYWVLTPLRTDQGFTVLVNRGFVPPAWSERGGPAANPGGERVVTGLLRLSEPGGAFLRANAPQAGRWYSRDVAAITAARHLGLVAPYFIDADAAPTMGGYPRGGLTVVRFPNNHLQYALTWFTLAFMAAAAVVAVGREEWRRRR